MSISGFFRNVFYKLAGGQTVRLDEPVQVSPATKVAVEEMAIFSCVNLLSGIIAKCEFKTYQSREPVQLEEYYLWNVEPNRNQNSVQLIQEFVARLLLCNEALMVEVGGQLLVVESYQRTQSALTDDAFTGVTCRGLTFRKPFLMSDVIFLTLNNTDIQLHVFATGTRFWWQQTSDNQPIVLANWKEVAAVGTPLVSPIPFINNLRPKTIHPPAGEDANIYWKNSSNEVTIIASCIKSGTSDDIPNGTVMFTLPTDCRPKRAIMKRLDVISDSPINPLLGWAFIHPSGSVHQGLLVVLPCKTGRTIYVIDSKKINHCITENVLVRNGLLARKIGTDTHYAVYPENIGKTVFLTRQEAEKALKEKERTCPHNTGDYCTALSDAEIKQPCIEGPCPLDAVSPTDKGGLNYMKVCNNCFHSQVCGNKELLTVNHCPQRVTACYCEECKFFTKKGGSHCKEFRVDMCGRDFCSCGEKRQEVANGLD